MSTQEVDLYGQHPVHGVLQDTNAPYESPEAYADQGDTRVVRNLSFMYLAATGEDAGGNPILQPVDVPRDTELTIAQMGLVALKRGEQEHAFYTTDELEAKNNPNPGAGGAAAVESGANLSDLGEYELAEWIEQEKPTINEVLEKVGDDKELAHRMLQAENIATGGEPRRGLEEGLRTIIQE